MKIEDGYVIFEPTDNVKIEPKRISGHSFVELLGLNKFTLKGDALLYMFNILHRNVDDIYQKRGEFAEKLVKRWLEQRGKTCITYDSKIVKYTNFPTNKNFSGVIDIDLPVERTLVEVKSKSMSKYSIIKQTKPLDEIYQAMLYAYLSGYKTFIMQWVFFDEQTKNEIFRGLKPTTLQNVKGISAVYQVDKSDIFIKMWQAKEIVDDFIKTKKIELKDISEKCFVELNKQNFNKKENEEQEVELIEEDLFTFNEADFEDMGF